jgi:signal transduction histidine kinase
LREYGQRFAFVAHDIKNVSSQLSLLLANAEHHLDNPEFQRDMLRTLRASVQKIGGLLARLQTPQDSAGQDGGEPVLPLERLQAIVAAQLNVPPVRLEHDGREGRIAMRPTAFDAVIAHLLDNAVEASAEGEAVRIRLRHEARRVLIDIVDHGSGMTPEFIRDRLFQPFRSSKRGGFGIGVYQARELVREAGGDLLVLSRPGLGTTMRLLLPLAGVPADQAASLSA